MLASPQSVCVCVCLCMLANPVALECMLANPHCVCVHVGQSCGHCNACWPNLATRYLPHDCFVALDNSGCEIDVASIAVAWNWPGSEKKTRFIPSTVFSPETLSMIELEVLKHWEEKYG